MIRSLGCDEVRLAPAYQPLTALAAAFAAGVVADRYWPVRVEAWSFAAAAALAAWLLAWRGGKTRTAALLLLTATAGLGAARHHLHWHVFPRNDLGRLADKTPRPACLQAVALENPRWRPAPPATPLTAFERGDQSQLDVRVAAMRDGRQWRPVSGRAELTVDGHLLDVRAGDRLRIDAELQRLEPPLNPGEFDFAAQQRAERKLCRLRADHPDAVTVLARGGGWNPRRVLQSLRDRGDVLLWRYVRHERAGLASALVLGSREQLDRERLEPFFLTGVMHVLAISGMHVAILISGFWLLVRTGVLRRRAALWSAMLLVTFYTLLTGAQAPVVRSAILVVVVCAANLTGRRPLAFNTLAAAALAVLAFNPAQLFDTGAQLSFLAVGVLAWIGPRVALWRRLPEDPLDRLVAMTRPGPQRLLRASWIRLAQALAASLGVWAAVLPLTMYRFHVAPPAAIVLNLLLCIPVTVALFSGFGVLLTGELFPPLAMLCGGLCDVSLWALEEITYQAQDIIPLHFWTPGPARWWVLCVYAALAAWAALPRWRPSPRWSAAIATVGMALGMAPPDHGFPAVTNPVGDVSVQQASLTASALNPPRGEQLHCTFMAVGHGVCALIEFPNGRTLLYDTGSLSPPTTSARAITAVLWSRGLRHVDAVVLSHADADHYNALPELLEKVSVGRVYVSPSMFSQEAPALGELRRAIERSGTPLVEIAWGDRLLAGPDTRVEVIHPPRWGVAESDNGNSIVLHVEAFGRRLLLPGDLEGTALADLLRKEPIDYDVVMAPHHGSRRSNAPGFAQWATPEVTVISGGRNDISAEVQHAYRTAGSQVFHTAEDGAVRVTLTRGGVIPQTWRSIQQAAR